MKLFKAIPLAVIIGSSLMTIASVAEPKEEPLIEWDENSRVSQITCEGLATFTLGVNQRPTQRDLPPLCNCLIKETNQKGWELAALKQLNSGEDPGFIKRNGAIARFGQAVDSCTSDKYYLSSTDSIVEVDSKGDGLNLGSKRLLGFLGGGPIGALIAPIAFDFFGGNLVIWIIAGVVVGGFLWQLSIGLVIAVVGSISSLFGPKKSND